MDRLSIKALTVWILMAIGLVATLLSFIAGQLFMSPALEEEKRVLSSVIKVAGSEVLKRATAQIVEMGSSAQKSQDFRNAISNIDTSENMELAVGHLNDQFAQHAISMGIIKLHKIRVYNPNLEFMFESSEGISGLPRSLPKQLLEQVKSRSGSDRLKVSHSTWLSPSGEAMSSVLIPVGALRVSSYMELIFDPAFSMQGLNNILDTPIRIANIADEVQFKTGSWPEKLHSNDLIVDYVFTTTDGKPAIKVETVEDITLFNGIYLRTQAFSAIAFIIVNALGIFVAFSLFSKYLFKPIRGLVQNMESMSNGDLTQQIESKGLLELQELSQY
ncbi:MAG: hypothetical protein OEX00_09935, partial [Gammaproteobacteria bacterium]|nr:hypothetical protein [Gammaproteobacteria bacterium]